MSIAYIARAASLYVRKYGYVDRRFHYLSPSPNLIKFCSQVPRNLCKQQPKNKPRPVLPQDFAGVDVCHLLAYSTPTAWAAMYAIRI